MKRGCQLTERSLNNNDSKAWRRGWDSDHLLPLNPRKLFILHSGKSDKTGPSAEVRYPKAAETRVPRLGSCQPERLANRMCAALTANRDVAVASSVRRDRRHDPHACVVQSARRFQRVPKPTMARLHVSFPCKRRATCGWKVTIHPEELGKLLDKWWVFLASGEPGTSNGKRIPSMMQMRGSKSHASASINGSHKITNSFSMSGLCLLWA